MFERIGGHVAGTHQVEQDAGISRAATRGHRYPVESGKSHRRVAADTAFERTDTCASAEVRCDDASAGEVWPAPFELGSDELIRSEGHTSELQSLMRISYAVFCLKKKNK